MSKSPLILLVLAACARPEVPIERSAGKAGEFCVTPADCDGGIACESRRCCAVSGCTERCDALMTAPGTAISAHYNEFRDSAPQLVSGCISLCCANTPIGEVERMLEGAVTSDPRARAHGAPRVAPAAPSGAP